MSKKSKNTFDTAPRFIRIYIYLKLKRLMNVQVPGVAGKVPPTG
jgi:hypothetical protein